MKRVGALATIALAVAACVGDDAARSGDPGGDAAPPGDAAPAGPLADAGAEAQVAVDGAATDAPIAIVCPKAPPVDFDAIPGFKEKCTRLVYVAGGSADCSVATSLDDGAHWGSVTSIPDSGSANNGPSAGRAFAFGFGRGVAVYTEKTLASGDGTTWPASDALPGWPYSVGLSFVNGLFIYLGRGSQFSFDGVHWAGFRANDPYPNGVLANFRAWQIAYGNKIYVAVGQTETGKAGFRTSTDGQTWSADVVLGSGYSGYLSTIVFGNGRFILGGTGSGAPSPNAEGITAWSSDGLTWNDVVTNEKPGPAGAIDFSQLAWNGATFVAAANIYSHGRWTSPDGVTWTAKSDAPGFAHLTAFENHFLAGGVSGQPNGVVALSDDGVTWTQQVAFPSGGESVDSVGIGRVLKGP